MPVYLQVIFAVILAIIFGFYFPTQASKMKPFGDAFIKLIKMCIAPIVFCTIVSGMVSGSNAKKVGKIGLKSIIYFEVLTTLALIIGALVAFYLKPGSGVNADLSSLDTSSIVAKEKTSMIDFLINIIPHTIFEAFTKGDVLSILFLAIFFGIALAQLKDRCKMLIDGINQTQEVLFKIVSIIVKLSPIGAFGAMSYTIGKFGIATLLPLIKLVACLYGTCLLFIILVFSFLLKICGTSLSKLVSHIKDEILITFGTCSSEAALPSLMKKMENFGCSKTIADIVIPAGYSFNLDGTSISFMMIILFVAQALNIDLSWMQILHIMLILMITSKGAAAVLGSAFATIATTLAIVDIIPVGGLVLILGIDRFMTEARAVTNIIGNATAAVVISKWEGEFKSNSKIFSNS